MSVSGERPPDPGSGGTGGSQGVAPHTSHLSRVDTDPTPLVPGGGGASLVVEQDPLPALLPHQEEEFHISGDKLHCFSNHNIYI